MRLGLGRLARRVIGVQLGQLWQHAPRPLRYVRLAPPVDGAQRDLPGIAIVTPVFNQGRFVGATLNSVLAQQYAPLEMVVKDGGSTDDTLAVLAGFGSRLTNVLSEPDTGQANAINIGFAQTSGELMAYLNADDLLLPHSLHFVASYFRNHPTVDVVYGHRVLIDENGEEIGRWVLPPHSDRVLSWADFVPQETLFWRRRLWDRVGGIDESFRFALDWDLLLRFRDAGARIVRLPYFLGAFRVHPQQKTSAQISTLGRREMQNLLRRVHGREVTELRRRLALVPYISEHVGLRHAYRLRGWC